MKCGIECDGKVLFNITVAIVAGTVSCAYIKHRPRGPTGETVVPMTGYELASVTCFMVMSTLMALNIG